MDIHISQFAGFCDGVKRAYDMIMELDLAALPKPVLALGSLVHNEEVAARIESLGIKTIDRETFFSARPGEIGTIIITAHGTGPDIFESAASRGIEIIDTTCPRVVKVQRLARVYAKRGYKIIIVGDKDHKEVRGINDWGDGEAYVISTERDIVGVPYGKSDKIAVLAQTTQNEDFFERVFSLLREKYENAEMIKTTCHATHDRQNEVKKLAGQNDAVIVIGSQKSANSKRLWEIAREINPKTYFIEKAGDISRDWFGSVGRVGVTAGASTPDWVIADVLQELKKI